jgi:hypothetical protein
MLFLSFFLVSGFGLMSNVWPYLIFKTYIFDKDASTLTLKKRGIWVNEVAERSLSEVSEVKLETIIYGENSMLYEVRLLMNGGDILSLGSSSNQKEQEKMADLIRTYLKARSN